MNISSVIIYAKTSELTPSILSSLNELDNVEVVCYEEQKIIILITSEDVNGEIACFKKIEAISGVLSAAMVYSYQEEIAKDAIKASAINASDIAQQINEKANAKEIKYSGELPV